MTRICVAAVLVATAACGKVEKAPDAAVPVALTVAVTGDGHVTSTPAGIDCPGNCTHDFEPGTQVTLTQNSLKGNSFTGWMGDACTGTADCMLTVSAPTNVTAAFVCHGMITFDYTGNPQTFIRPECTNTFTVDARGGGGGQAFFNGNLLGTAALGGRVQATMTFQPTDVVYVVVGGAGGNGAVGTVGPGGYNGGANGATNSNSQFGGGGGGASDIRVGGLALPNRVLVAGGAGGVASCGGSAIAAGVGGGTTGGSGGSCGGTNEVVATGGTQAAGGTPGTYVGYGTASPGTSGVGGIAFNTTGGGGGGGGYFGGGGGSWNGGGGGSSYAAAAIADAMHTQGFQMGAGQVIFTY